MPTLTGEGPVAAPSTPLLSTRSVSKAYAGIPVLKGIDLVIAPGEIHALMGENGAGKSTMMKVLCGILKADEGTIRIDGREQDFAHYDDAIAAGVGIVLSSDIRGKWLAIWPVS